MKHTPLSCIDREHFFILNEQDLCIVSNEPASRDCVKFYNFCSGQLEVAHGHDLVAPIGDDDAFEIIRESRM